MVRFLTSTGVRKLDVCQYHSWFHWLIDSVHPIQCWEMKSTQKAKDDYFNKKGRQYDQDLEIMAYYKFPISIIWGRCNWEGAYLDCY